jgi:hypothetical protein
MNTDPEHGMSFEEQFAAFNGQSEYRPEQIAPLHVEQQQPALLVAVPEPAAVAVPPAPPVVEAAPPAPQPVEDVQTQSLLADLDKATESLTLFRQEIGRLVQLQRTTAVELENSRRELATLAAQPQECDDCRRLEDELSRQRALVSAVRSKLGEVFATLDTH